MGVAFSVCTGRNELKICIKWDYRISNICEGDSGGSSLKFLTKMILYIIEILSGAPLFKDKIQVGIASFGLGRCRDKHASGFVKVAAYREWIRAITLGQSFS